MCKNLNKIILSSILCLFLFLGCDAKPKKMSETESNILFEAVTTRNLESQLQALEILNTRIEKYHLKLDYANKITLLLAMKEFEVAYETTEEILSHHPEYVEILTIHTVLAKYLLDEEESEAIYKNTLDIFNTLPVKDNAKQYSILSNTFLIATIFSDMSLKEDCYQEIMNADFEDYEKEIVEEINRYSVDEMLEVFGIIEE